MGIAWCAVGTRVVAVCTTLVAIRDVSLPEHVIMTEAAYYFANLKNPAISFHPHTMWTIIY